MASGPTKCLLKINVAPGLHFKCSHAPICLTHIINQYVILLCFTEHLSCPNNTHDQSKLMKVCFSSDGRAACFDFMSDGTVKLKEPVCVYVCVLCVSTALITIIASAAHHSPSQSVVFVRDRLVYVGGGCESHVFFSCCVIF